MRNVPSRCEPVSGGGGAREAAAASPGAQLSRGHYRSGVPGAFQEARSPGGRGGWDGEGTPHLFLPSHSLLLPRASSRRPLDPVTLAVEPSQVGPCQTRTGVSAGSSKDPKSSQASLSPRNSQKC